MHDTKPIHRTTIGYRPALDGLRGLAVVAVLAFHLGFSWAVGGYLGVSVFFTLSGFLITTLLLAERTGTGAIDLKRFWARRARRLLPAAMAGLIVAALVAAALPTTAAGTNVDLLAALGDVANWRFLLAGKSYGALFASPSPALHFWSLSIEEQFYAVFPVVALLALRRRRSQRSLLTVLGVGIAISWLALAVCAITGSHDVAYYATITRAGELLMGAVAAVLVHRARHAAPTTNPVLSRLHAQVELGALGTLLVLMATVPEQSTALEHGVLPLVAILSSIVIAGAFRSSTLARGLAVRPLAQLGRISYGVYVYHWPLFLLLTTGRTGLTGIALTGVRLAATFALAGISYVALERPIREGRWPRPAVAIRLVPAGFALTALVVVLTVPQPDRRTTIDFASARATVAAPSVDAPPTVLANAVRIGAPADLAAPLVTVPLDHPEKIAVFGDSTALMVTAGLAPWGTETGRLDIALGYTELGCGLLPGFRRFQGEAHPNVPACTDWRSAWEAQLADHPADVAVVLLGPWDVADHQLPGDDAWRHIGDPVLDAALQHELDDADALLLAHVRRVIWLTSPDTQDGLAIPNAPPGGFPESDPARMARYNDMLRGLARENPSVRVVDLNGYLAAQPGGELDRTLRPDGVHFSNESTKIVAPWIGESIISAATAP